VEQSEELENIIENLHSNRVFATINCHFLAIVLAPAQSEGKFNQVIKHFVLKHQLNLMAFPLALSFIAASPLESLSDLHFPVNNRSESETNCNCFSLSI
jgi:menaquinone-dependent protoporphyrinogen IX oxidase